MIGLRFVLNYLLVSFLVCSRLEEEERVSFFTLCVFLVSCDCLCFVALPSSVVGWSAVCG